MSDWKKGIQFWILSRLGHPRGSKGFRPSGPNVLLCFDGLDSRFDDHVLLYTIDQHLLTTKIVNYSGPHHLLLNYFIAFDNDVYRSLSSQIRERSDPSKYFLGCCGRFAHN